MYYTVAPVVQYMERRKCSRKRDTSDVSPYKPGSAVVRIGPTSLEATLHNRSEPLAIKGTLAGVVVAEGPVWAAEGRKPPAANLVKSHRKAGGAWPSPFLDGSYAAGPPLFDEMEKKMALERFALGGPGLDSSGAGPTGGHRGGGPKMGGGSTWRP